MEVDLIFKIAAVGILVAVLNLLLSRAGRDEQALMTTIAGLVVVLIIIVQEISGHRSQSNYNSLCKHNRIGKKQDTNCKLYGTQHRRAQFFHMPSHFLFNFL